VTSVVAAAPTPARAAVRFDPPGSDGIGRIVIDRPDDSVNALNAELIEDLAAAVRAARAADGIRGLVVTSAKPNQWVAGADLKLVTQATEPAQLERASRRLQAVADELAWLPFTTVAAINGAALGGGLELALACDYRVAADSSSVVLGQPEVNLGLVPAGGGTQRLPRLVGLQRALDLILSGRRLNARRARRAGLLDEVVHPTVLDQAARAWTAKPKRPLDRPLKLGLNVAAAMDVAEQTPAGRQVMYRQARQAVLKRTAGHYPAPLKALEAIEVGYEHGLARGFEAEAKAFGELALSDTAKNLIWLFLATQRQRRPTGRASEALNRDASLPPGGAVTAPEPGASGHSSESGADARGPSNREDSGAAAVGGAAAGALTAPEAGDSGDSSAEPSEVRHGADREESRAAAGQRWRRGRVERMAVVGAGFMGAAIAEVAAAAGLSVRVRDVKPEAVAKGLSRIRRMVDGGVARRRFEPREGQAILQRVSGTTDYSGFPSVDLVIEAVFEDLQVKHNVLEELERVMSDEAVIASNTSALPIREIAAAAKRPERIVGMHFFSPAERMPLLEVIRPNAAADWAVDTAVEVGTRMGKTVIVVGDTPGFYTSRVLGVMLNEAAVLLDEGAAMADIDRAMTSFGFPVGPFVLYDEVGLEVALHAGETVSRAFGDRIPAPSIVPHLVSAGQTGRQSGAGFYLWPKPSGWPLPGPLRRLVRRPSRVPNPAVAAMTSRSARAFSQTEIQDRLALLFVNEAIRCLGEGVLQSPTDGDLGAVLGLGFPPFLGGPFHHADALGLATLERKLRGLAESHGQRYEPATLLVDYAREGRNFYGATT
jgi:3-hydroxyacyl-CoA dehydrogenase/enoyl-CoA hydratase/3-hydroxybutyryl-CoA epimerase